MRRVDKSAEKVLNMTFSHTRCSCLPVYGVTASHDARKQSVLKPVGFECLTLDIFAAWSVRKGTWKRGEVRSPGFGPSPQHVGAISLNIALFKEDDLQLNECSQYSFTVASFIVAQSEI